MSFPIRKKKYFQIIILLLVFSSSCFLGCSNTDNADFYSAKCFFELKIDNKISRDNTNSASSEIFDILNYFSKSQKEINYGFGILNISGIQAGTIYLNTQLDRVTYCLSITPLDYYDTDGLYKNCSNNNSSLISVPLNITRNDNQIGGIIEGNFEGTIAKPSTGIYSPCNNCCYNFIPFSGRFRLKIKN